MAILCTDAAFKKKCKKVIEAKPHNLWRELHEIAMFFALIGAVDDALSIWRFMYDGLVPIPDEEDRTINVVGDSAISAVCYCLGLPDISKGRPKPKICYKIRRPFVSDPDFSQRVNLVDDWCWEGIADGPWWHFDGNRKRNRESAIARQFADGPVATDTASPPADGDIQALATLTRLLAGDPAAEGPYTWTKFTLMAADFASQLGNQDEAIRFLQMWHDHQLSSRGISDTAQDAFALIPIAKLICAGTLAKQHSLTSKETRQLATTIIEKLTARLTAPVLPEAAQWKHKLSVTHGQFYLEPLQTDEDAEYFQEDGESEQGFSSFPCQVAIGVPGHYSDCVVEAEFGKRVPSIKTAIQAVAVPLNVTKSGGIYLHTVLYSGKDFHLEIPEGRYVVIARCFRNKPGKKKDSCSDSFRFVLTFLPHGTVPAGCLKTLDGVPPENVHLNASG